MSIKIDRLQGLLDHARKLHGNIKALRGLATVKLQANEHHKRVHMITVRSSCAAVKGNPFSCKYARSAVDATRGIYACWIGRRVAHMLEQNERGELEIFTYAIPDRARANAVKFDKSGAMPAHTIAFWPLQFSQTVKGRSIAKGTGTPHGKRKGHKRAYTAAYTRVLYPVA